MAARKTKPAASTSLLASGKVTVLSHDQHARIYLTLRGLCGVEAEGFTSDQVAAVLDKANGANITVRLNSGAGRIREALAVHDLLVDYAGKGPGTVHCSLEGIVAGPALAVALAASHWHVDPGVWVGLVEPPISGVCGATMLMNAALELDWMTNRLAGMVLNSFRDQEHRKGLGSLKNVRDIMAAGRWVQGPGKLGAYLGVPISFVRDSSAVPVAPVPGPYATLYPRCPEALRQIQIENRISGEPLVWAAKI